MESRWDSGNRDYRNRRMTLETLFEQFDPFSARVPDLTIT
jgi:hypothetical protein